MTYEAVTFGNDEWRAVVDGKLQKPTFNSKGAAIAFAKPVAEGKRKAEPVEETVITYEAVMKRLQDEGYENCHGDGYNQIIVNNRGEIEFSYEAMTGRHATYARLYDRLTPDYGRHLDLMDIDLLFADIEQTWTKEEPK